MGERARSTADHIVGTRVWIEISGVANARVRRRPAMSNWANGRLSNLVLSADLGEEERTMLPDGRSWGSSVGGGNRVWRRVVEGSVN